MLLGAFGNAGLAAVVPVLIGEAFNAILADPPDSICRWAYSPCGLLAPKSCAASSNLGEISGQS
jgi:hypothetical protein